MDTMASEGKAPIDPTVAGRPPGRRVTPYAAVWRWHFVAGLLVAPVLLVLAVTGGAYLFKDEFEAWWHADVKRLAPAAAGASGPSLPVSQPVSAQQAAVLAAHPGATVKTLLWPADDTSSAEWMVRTAEGRSLSVFVDPRDARVIGEIADADRLMHVLVDLHGELLVGRTGDWIVELASSWTLVMLVTGAWLWWPRRWRWRGVWVPRLRSSGRRFWRDVHAVPAVFNLVFVGFLVLSGLPWSGFWGEQLARLGTLSGTLAPSPNFHVAPSLAQAAQDRPVTAGAHNHEPAEPVGQEGPGMSSPDSTGDRVNALPWTVRQAPHARPPSAAGSAAGPTATAIDAWVATARSQGLLEAGPRLRFFWPRRSDDVVTVSIVPARAQDQRTLYLDPANGRVLRDIGWRDYSALGKTVEWGVMAHMGQQFGAFNRWLALGVCVLLVLTLVSGVVMWWRRRPAGQIGLPDKPASHRLPAGLVALLVALGVLFPMAGASMLVVAVGQWGWSRWLLRSQA